MAHKVTCIILAGGRGSRLSPLTENRSKPAVPIAGKFRLIDIPISNCLHAGVRHIWIITQFSSESLHRHILTSYHMDAFAKGFISILAATQTANNVDDWYKGTADAVRKNLKTFDDAFENIMILSGDHLYRMDYQKFIQFHISNKADITVGAVPVPQSQVSELGVLKMDEQYKIVDFHEKPQEESVVQDFSIPKEVFEQQKEKIGLKEDQTHLASMGIYLFKKSVLFDLLEKNDYEDFGKEIIPKSLNTHKVYAYPFNGYWEDIGTIKSFFNAHIALTKPVPEFNFYDESLPIFTHARFLPAAKINGANITASIVSEGSIIDKSIIQDSVIGVRAVIHENCEIKRSIVMGADYYEEMNQSGPPVDPQKTKLGIGKNSIIHNSIIDKDVRIGENVRLINQEKVQEGERDNIVIKNGIIVVPKGTTLPDGFVL